MTKTPWLLILLLIFLVSLASTGRVHAVTADFLPAGTLLHCTLDEPNFSSKTVQVGDPTLCYLSTVTSFGHAVFPRGAYLTGHLQEAKDPGHFVGKGWMEIDFDRIIMPGPVMLPLSAKIIAAPHYKVDAEGKIHGKGHPVRDAVEWAIPPLWPVKIITLPRRGPYATLKGEYRMTLRLMEDVEIPTMRASVPVPPWANQSGYLAPPDFGYQRSLMQPASTNSNITSMSSGPVIRSATYSQSSAKISATSEPTLLALKDGSAVLAHDYWIEGDQVHCVTQNAGEKFIPLAALDLSATVRFNQERHVNFVLKSRDALQTEMAERH